MQVSIITPLFNRLDLTRACLESLRRTLDGWDYEWILIDDGSTDGTREFLRMLAAEDPRVRVVLNDAPRGYAANNNHGARIARAPLLCLLNNDTVLLPGWLEPMARLARLLQDVACVGNVQREPGSGLVDHAGIYFNLAGEAQHAARNEPTPPRADYLEWPAVTAACCVIRRKIFLKLGGFDEAFHNGSEDVDFCLRAQTRGFRHFVANRSVIYHYVSASPGRKQSEEENLRIFRERWLAHLQTGRNVHRLRSQQAAEGWDYLRKRRWRPWRYNLWRVSHALGQILSPRPPMRQLDLLPRMWFGAQDFLRQRRARKRAAAVTTEPPAEAPVFLVVGDTAQTAGRAGVPSAVRSLAGAFGRMGAPVHPVMWKPATRSLCLLPLELSVCLDAERLRTGRLAAWYEPCAASLYASSAGNLHERYTDTLAIHDLLPAVPRGAWIVLPEVLYQGRTGQILEYAREHGLRVAVILYDTMPTNEPPWFPPEVPREHDAYLRTVSRADLVLPVSEFTAEDWRRFVAAKALPDPPLVICAPGADTCTRTRETTELGRGPANPARPLRMLCVSAVEPRKNHRTLIEAFDHVAAARPGLNLELILVGMPHLFSEDNVPEAVRVFVERYPGKVTWTEWVEYSTLRNLYETCDFTVFPSKLEGWAAPVVESLWFGKPCICADQGAMAEAAAGGGCVTVDVYHEGVLTEAILSLAESPERLAAMTAEALARPLKSWEEYAREVLGVLQTFGAKTQPSVPERAR